MSTAMYSAREAIVPGSAYDRNRMAGNGTPGNTIPSGATYGNYQAQDFLRPHDTMNSIDQKQRAFNSMNVPIPMPMFMPAYYDSRQMQNQTNTKGANRRKPTRSQLSQKQSQQTQQSDLSQMNSQNSQVNNNT